VVIVGLRALSNYLATVAFALAGSRVATRLRATVFAHIQSLSSGYHATSRRGDLVQRLVGDVGKLQDVAVTAGLPLLANIITLVVMAIVMAIIDPLLACVVVLAAGAFALSSRGSAQAITQASRKTRRGEGELANIAQESLGAIDVVHAYGLEEEIGRGFAGSNQRTLADGVKAKRLAAGLERRTDVIVGVATALVLAGGGGRGLSAWTPLRHLAYYAGRSAGAAASGEGGAAVLAAPVDIADDDVSRRLPVARGRVEFRRVRYGYDPGAPTLTDVDLTVPAGQRVAIVGPSGAGKSTLSRLLPRLIDPDRGTVLLDGLDIRRITLESLRSHIALVPQDTVLFSGTIRQSIRQGRLDAADDEVEAAARA